MKTKIELREIGFSHHVWNDFKKIGFTTQDLAEENQGLRQNHLTLLDVQTQHFILLHHWTIIDETQSPLRDDDLRIQFTNSAREPETHQNQFLVEYFLVRDERTQKYLEAKGLTAKICPPGDLFNHFILRKKNNIWAVKGTADFSADKISPRVLESSNQNEWHLHSESNCLDFLISTSAT